MSGDGSELPTVGQYMAIASNAGMRCVTGVDNISLECFVDIASNIDGRLGHARIYGDQNETLSPSVIMIVDERLNWVSPYSQWYPDSE